MSQQFAADYIDVATRIADFRRSHPEGSLQPVDPAKPYEVQTIGDQTFIVYTAAAYRTPDDARPGIGVAWESFPGRTPYTRGSELMNAETSAWGRAIVAALAGDTKKSVASAEEVRNRQAERDVPPAPAPDPISSYDELGEIARELYDRATDAADMDGLGKIWGAITAAGRAGQITPREADFVRSRVQSLKEELSGSEAA